MSREKERLLFSERLKSLCDDMGLPESGRQSAIAKVVKQSQQAVSKWLNAESVPVHNNRVLICDYFKVNYEWLASGIGPKYRSEVIKDEVLDLIGVDKAEVDLPYIKIMKTLSKVAKEDRPELEQLINDFLLTKAKKNRKDGKGK